MKQYKLEICEMDSGSYKFDNGAYATMCKLRSLKTGEIFKGTLYRSRVSNGAWIWHIIFSGNLFDKESIYCTTTSHYISAVDDFNCVKVGDIIGFDLVCINTKYKAGQPDDFDFCRYY